MRGIIRVLDINPKRRADLVIPNRSRMASYVAESDVVIVAVLVAGAKAPKLVSREMVASMRDGSVVVDVSIDQGGCGDGSSDDPLRSDLRGDQRYATIHDEDR